LRRRLVLAALLLPAAARAQVGEVRAGQTLRDAEMAGLNGPPRRLSAFRGTPLLINVWASWCGPCRAEMASLERLAWQPHEVSFAIIGISTDDDADAARRLLRQTNASISHYIDRRLELESMLGASRLPLTVLVDARGRVVDKIFGAQEWDGPQARGWIRAAFQPARR
jgi:thiol-disulfide isomerase/thioredoxin